MGNEFLVQSNVIDDFNTIVGVEDRLSFFSKKKNFALLENYLSNYIGDFRILSLDVFDTLLLRDDSSELTRFFEIGKRMSKFCNDKKIRVTPTDAFLARYYGTKATYRTRSLREGCREGSLDEIHQTASRILVGNDELASDFVGIELEFEASTLKVNAWLLGQIEEAKQDQKSVILLSDMYMHSRHIEMLLELLKVKRSLFDGVFSSADLIVSKHSGKVFSHIEKNMDASSSDFFHLGDSLKSDFVMPMRSHWKACQIPISNPSILRRIEDHRNTVNYLKKNHGIMVDINEPS